MALEADDSLSSVSTTSLVFDRLQEEMEKPRMMRKTGSRRDANDVDDDDDDFDQEEDQPDAGNDEAGPFLASSTTTTAAAGGASAASVVDADRRRGFKPMDRRLRRGIIAVVSVVVALWLVALTLFATGSYKHVVGGGSDEENASSSSSSSADKMPVSLDEILTGYWYPRSRSISWIAGPDGRDGLLLEEGAPGKDYLVVEDVRSWADGDEAAADGPRTLMKSSIFVYEGTRYSPDWLEPSPDLSKVLLAVDREKLWRHSFTAVYFILHVASGRVEPLVPHNDTARVQLASWSPSSDALSFTLDNDLYVRRLLGNDSAADRVTTDGGPEYFYGVPDWVYEEEVLSDRTATWWSSDGRHLAFLRTNETAVRTFPIDYYLHRPSGTSPAPGDEAYPETRHIKYPKPGSSNPTVDVLFYDTAERVAFPVPGADAFADDDRIVGHVLWAGNDGVLIKQTNRVGDHQRTVLVDVAARTARVVHDVDGAAIDGGWLDLSRRTAFVPADPDKGRPLDGYVDTVIHQGFEHLAYFTPLDAAEPTTMLTSGPWEVDSAPAAVDLANNLVYLVAARQGPTQRHVYSVRLLDGSGLEPLTPVEDEAYYDASFSAGAGFALVSYHGPDVPSQRVVSTPSASRRDADLVPAKGFVVEDNSELASRVRSHALPRLRRAYMDMGDGLSLSYLERRPPPSPRPTPHHHQRRLPVLFHQYSGPGSQSVTHRFAVDFQSYVASSLGYIVITVDPRGTGFRGRRHRVPVRSHLGVIEADDLSSFARAYASRNSEEVDPARLAIWGWSYGGFQTLKTLEHDAGRTFSYGLAVAPVTDWRLYDSIYTERYMRLPSDNGPGYDASAVTNASALGGCARFLVMHGTADDNVHFQNSLRLLDGLDRAGVENYDVHVFPDSDHSITFHSANRIVYDKLNTWLINAFNGEWLKVKNPQPIPRSLGPVSSSSSP
ncbi:hypothetical protein L249_8303 [Ophiocordyceps polyrhachis-furcata BCC 54312]|uniref:Probable dipeptidyl-aminopeptidase B n=1 Tax=Ophiocordyceps polyrhachis-furcata BCC 54312 TaxID=1330021 RepID=A0A367LHS8_9HYPO|nr:hypothetical protein L249_8303 [Ophiocordyceps polyrhachis-furcata BCC 54312]